MSLSFRTRITALACTVGLLGGAAACGSSSSGGSTDAPTTELSVLATASATGLDEYVAAFNTANPDVLVTVETAPSGDDMNNLVKTKLSTGEMNDVFLYNTGSLFGALNPDQTLTNLSDEKWAGGLIESMKTVVSTANGTYGVPFGTAQGGGVMYNKAVYAELGLTVPATWAEFEANNNKIKAAGKVAIAQSFGDAWTSQILDYGMYANVAAKDPDWATEWVLNKRNFVDAPGSWGYVATEKAGKGGWFNRDFASATLEKALRMLATGEAVQFPMLTSTISTVRQNTPDKVEDIGIFPVPTMEDGAKPHLTIWMPNAFYIPKSTEGAKLEAAKKFLAFTTSEQGCKVQTEVKPVSGPLTTTDCKLPDNVPAVVKEMQPYFDANEVSPALEFVVSKPIVINGHEKITVEVASGIISAAQGGKLADQAAALSAQTLGLPGW